MQHYQAPLDDMRYVIEEWLEAPKDWQQMPALAEIDASLARQVLEEAARFATEELTPLNASGDRLGCTYAQGEVRTPQGFAAAYQAFVDCGWPALTARPEDGGQGLPQLLNVALLEMLYASNHAWAMYTGIAHGAYECLRHHAPAWLRDRYLKAIVSGTVLPTMCLTEPQAGSDIGLLRCRAEAITDGSYQLTGNKIFASGGEHDLTDDILHLVLARLPDAPTGSRGISLFAIPKRLADGSRNAVHCDGIEHKMGIRGSATCCLRFDQAKGWLLGEPHKGLEAMFLMMNSARLYVGMQGLGYTESASQQAHTYARERRQMRAIARPKSAPHQTDADPIHYHPPVRQALLSLHLSSQGMRMLGYWVAHLLDQSEYAQTPEQRERSTRLAALLTPLVKASFTEQGFRQASAALQVFGGYGYSQDYAIEQTLRDSRIAMIYEGTNEIQANDLLVRKVLREPEALQALLALICDEAEKTGNLLNWRPAAQAVLAQCTSLENAVAEIAKRSLGDAEVPYRVAGNFLCWLAQLSLGFVWLRAARLAEGRESDLQHLGKQESARCFFDRFEAEAQPYVLRVRSDLESTLPFFDA